MDLEVRLDSESMDFAIDDPYHPDLDRIIGRIGMFMNAQGMISNGLDIQGLLPLMIRGVVGCEEGCPANARDLVERGYRDFSLEYIEGGILTAKALTPDGRALMIKLFPEF